MASFAFGCGERAAGSRELLMLTKQNGANVLVNFCTILMF
jgi:hypothetical protein